MQCANKALFKEAQCKEQGMLGQSQIGRGVCAG